MKMIFRFLAKKSESLRMTSFLRPLGYWPNIKGAVLKRLLLVSCIGYYKWLKGFYLQHVLLYIKCDGPGIFKINKS